MINVFTDRKYKISIHAESEDQEDTFKQIVFDHTDQSSFRILLPNASPDPGLISKKNPNCASALMMYGYKCDFSGVSPDCLILRFTRIS